MKNRFLAGLLAAMMTVSMAATTASATEPERAQVVEAAFVDKSATNGEGRIDNVLIYEEYLANEAAVTYDVGEMDTDISSSITNGNGGIKHIIVVDTDVMPLTGHKDIELPANTAVYFTGEAVSSATMSVTYMPTKVNLYYGLGTKNNGTGDHYAYLATDGAGSATISVSTSGNEYLYPYLANRSNKTVYADFVYTISTNLSLQNENAE